MRFDSEYGSYLEGMILIAGNAGNAGTLAISMKSNFL